MSVKLLTELHLEFLSLKEGYTDSSQSGLVKMPHCWKSHLAAHYIDRLMPYIKFDINYIRPFISVEQNGDLWIGFEYYTLN